MKCAMVVLGSLAMASAFVPAAPKMSRSKYTTSAGWSRTRGGVERGLDALREAQEKGGSTRTGLEGTPIFFVGSGIS